MPVAVHNAGRGAAANTPPARAPPPPPPPPRPPPPPPPAPLPRVRPDRPPPYRPDDRYRRSVRASGPGPVVQVHDAGREATRGQQLEVDPDLDREPAGAAADDDRRDELVQLVDQPGRERLAGQV